MLDILTASISAFISSKVISEVPFSMAALLNSCRALAALLVLTCTNVVAISMQHCQVMNLILRIKNRKLL